jgi:hypothetical protein
MVTFRGDTISLALPDSFSGGNAKDPDVQAKFDALAAAGKSALSIKAEVEGGMELIMITEPNADGFRAAVTAQRKDFDVEGSMESWVKSYTRYVPEAKIKTLTQSRAYVVARFSFQASSNEPTTEQRWIFKKVGSQLYVVSYVYNTQSNPELGSIYLASEKTISIKGN